jgi:hypothetical protein
VERFTCVDEASEVPQRPLGVRQKKKRHEPSVVEPVVSLSCARVVSCSPVCPLDSLGFNFQSRRRSRRLPSSRQTRHPRLDPHLTSLPQTSIEGRRRSCIPKKTQESGEDEVSSAIFPKRSTNCLDRKIATDLADSCQLLKR